MTRQQPATAYDVITAAGITEEMIRGLWAGGYEIRPVEAAARDSEAVRLALIGLSAWAHRHLTLVDEWPASDVDDVLKHARAALASQSAAGRRVPGWENELDEALATERRNERARIRKALSSLYRVSEPHDGTMDWDDVLAILADAEGEQP